MRAITFLVFSLLGIIPLWGVDFTVSNNADSGAGSLRQAITDFNGGSASNRIVFDAGLGMITLSSNLPLITQTGPIVMPSGDMLIIDGTAVPYRIFGATSRAISISIQVPSSSSLNLSGLMDGNGALLGSGAGNLILSGTNTYTAGTVINSNLVLSLSGTGTLVPTSGVVVNNSSTFDISNITAPGQTIGTLSGIGNGNEVVELGSKNLTVNTTGSPTYEGIIRGTGSFTKQGTGTQTLIGANTYSGGTTVIGGVLQGNTTGLQGNILNNAIVTFDQTTTGTYAGVMSGTGRLTKQNSGTLIVTGANTYSGGTTVSGGVLQGNTTSLQGNIVNNGIVVFDQVTTGTYAGVISEQGRLFKQNSGTLILTGANTYTGGTTVGLGVLQGNTTSLQGNIANSATVVFDQAAIGTYTGVMSGTGSLIKQGTGVVNFTGDSSGFSSGTVDINAGTLLVNGMLGGTFTVAANAILGGDGTAVGNVTNNGSVQPGNSIGTLTINGNYTQGASGILNIEINEVGATDLLDVTGTATLNGVLQVSPEPGIYLEGTTYTFLTAGSVTGQFSSTFSTRPLDYTINYFPTQAQLFILSSSLILPARPRGNAGAVVDYLFCSSFDFANQDLDTIAKALLALPADQYAKALNRLTPSQFGALALNELENNFSIVNSFLEANQAACYNFCESTHLWINPLGLAYSQKSRLQLGQEVIGFTNHTYGVAAGIDHVFNDWTLGFGLGYSYSHLHWKDQAGKARADSGYLGPYIRYNSERFYFDFLILGAGNFYDIDRRIVFPGLDRKTQSHPTTWDLSEVVLAGFKLEPFYKFFVQPELLLDQLNIFQESFHENGASSIDLAVKRKYTSFLRSLINLKFVKERVYCNMCLAPSINIGWLRTTPLTGRHYTASFRKDTFCEPNFSVTSFSEVVDQVLVSGQILLSSQGGFSLVLGYEGRFGNGSKVNEVDVALDWRF